MITVLNKTQTITSAGTSINSLNGAYKLIVGEYPKATTIFDYGCGKYDTNMNFATDNGFIWFGIDPYNRSLNWNKSNIDAMKNWCDYPDIIMLNNILNVIKEESIILNILGQVYAYAGENTDIYITIYEGNKSGIGKVTSKGYQRNQKLNHYIDYICEFFDVVEKVSGNILKCKKIN